MPTMKDSGIEWIGEIPSHWDCIRGKYIFTQRNERGNTIHLQLLSPTQNYGVVPQDVYEELSGMKVVKLNEDTDLNTLKTIHKGDFCISLRSFQGGFEYSEYEGVVSPAYQVFCPIVPVSRGYYKYLFKDVMFIEKMNSYTLSLRDGKNISFADFGNTYIPVPPIEEQIEIATFLDAKCAEMDALAADIQAGIDSLEAYKRSVITEAVTKGLNPAAEMKDSGVPWIGLVPSTWRVDKIKYHFKRNEPRNPGNVEVLSVYRDYGVIPKDSRDDNHNVTSEDTSKYKFVHKGDLVINKMKAWQGSLAVSEYEGIVSPAYFVFNFTDGDFNKKYFHYHIRSCYKDEFRRISGGIREGQWDLPPEEFINEFILLPPLVEQNKIVNFIDRTINETDAIINEKKEQLTILDEYKKSVIYEYVTGKKEVPTP